MLDASHLPALASKGGLCGDTGPSLALRLANSTLAISYQL